MILAKRWAWFVLLDPAYCTKSKIHTFIENLTMDPNSWPLSPLATPKFWQSSLATCEEYRDFSYYFVIFIYYFVLFWGPWKIILYPLYKGCLTSLNITAYHGTYTQELQLIFEGWNEQKGAYPASCKKPFSCIGLTPCICSCGPCRRCPRIWLGHGGRAAPIFDGVCRTPCCFSCCLVLGAYGRIDP